MARSTTVLGLLALLPGRCLGDADGGEAVALVQGTVRTSMARQPQVPDQQVHSSDLPFFREIFKSAQDASGNLKAVGPGVAVAGAVGATRTGTAPNRLFDDNYQDKRKFNAFTFNTQEQGTVGAFVAGGSNAHGAHATYGLGGADWDGRNPAGVIGAAKVFPGVLKAVSMYPSEDSPGYDFAKVEAQVAGGHVLPQDIKRAHSAAPVGQGVAGKPPQGGKATLQGLPVRHDLLADIVENGKPKGVAAWGAGVEKTAPPAGQPPQADIPSRSSVVDLVASPKHKADTAWPPARSPR